MKLLISVFSLTLIVSCNSKSGEGPERPSEEGQGLVDPPTTVQPTDPCETSLQQALKNKVIVEKEYQELLALDFEYLGKHKGKPVFNRCNRG
ncbi:hypothetical protein [Pseudobacteriovorax antillogorgiicola]|uniref:Lipoprotein n=1 Tax=Pseudobacteriovorax antillogorgiicola TaxID=1513793 RepID=A0A1Y6CT48_9BACT|nr:hypothetical protein [Pseudobacteriovorax antillogorgiicola]TCS45612.1 hypothetical protein EDD56_1274 [Pseudobacteriovorax antillogorgiicola]SMF72352.1 hypothetical protein SAMN06296036_1273 [Pseudobacteriovorax antillogorgiicola]